MKHKNFSHIYVEEDAATAPMAVEIVQRFPNASIIPIRSYSDVFNRPQQEWQIQKQSQKLILAKKRDGLLYPGTSIAPNFGLPNFFYNTPLLNCVYDCSYCYLQGLYQSANLVLFVNEEDFFGSVETALTEHESMYLCISYETDLLGFESLFGLNRRWIQFAKNHSSLLIESRTKSANFTALKDVPPIDNFIFAWTLSPDQIQQQYEQRTPVLKKRIDALCAAMEAGWPVRVCLDPLLAVENWESVYSDFIAFLADHLPLHKVRDFTVGVFRMNQGFLKQIKKQQRNSSLLYYPYIVEDGVASYGERLEIRLKEYVLNHLVAVGVDTNKIAVV